VNGNVKTFLSAADQSKFYTGDCYIFQYTYAGDDKEECLIGTWFGNRSVEVTSAHKINISDGFKNLNPHRFI
jgi:gelsolin